MTSFITAVGTAVTDLMGIISGVTTALLTNELFILFFGMAVISVGIGITIMLVNKIRGGKRRR